MEERERMIINFNEIQEHIMPGMNHGTGEMSAKMFMDEQGKIIPCTIYRGGSIGMHKHETSDDINYIISGKGKAICDGQEETLVAGICHVCKKGQEHSIINTGEDDLVILTVVVER
jgi:mannose-6-phosphate isomerase-like protein (cupin superfamily)